MEPEPQRRVTPSDVPATEREGAPLRSPKALRVADLLPGLGLFLAGVLVTVILRLRNAPAIARISLSGAFDAVVAFYLIAQVLERVIEPFTDLVRRGRFTDRRFRAITFAGLAGGLGTIACYLTTGIFTIVGVTFTYEPRLLDALLSGLLLTGGTKGLHDLISLVAGTASSKGD